ncbi:MAG TPA: glycosyltransferase family 1 protein [Longimicrobium sp.]
MRAEARRGAAPSRAVGTPPEPRSLLVDARGLRLSGIGRYTREVLARVLRDPRFGRVALLGRPGELHPFLQELGDAGRAVVVPFEHHYYSPGAQAHWLALGARGALAADAGFFPHYDVPLGGPLPPSLVTVHDLAQFRLPALFPAWKRALGGVVLRSAVRRALRVVADSRFTRDDLAARFPHAVPKLEVVPLGVGGGVTARAPSDEALRRAEAFAPFLLVVGNQKPHKNLRAALQVLARLRAERPGLRLVVAGRHYPGDEPLAARARELGLGDAVADLGAVDDDLLRALYGRAECLLFPSYFEGFGLPVLEAMACGLPVVASNRASIPEAVGDAGLMADPDDWDALADAVRRLRPGPLRDEMVARGRRRAALLTWDATAARTADLLWEVARGAVPRRDTRTDR